MSTYEAAYKSLLQGVSQQLPEERLPGQLTAQTNMLSDPVTNLRRRPGALFRKAWSWTDADDAHILGWFTDIAGSRVHILLNTVDGNVRILNEDFVQEASLDGGAYLTNADPTRIRATSVGNEFFFCNVDKIPVVNSEGTEQDPSLAGFFYIVTGSFGKTYEIGVVHSGGTYTASYTTPGGTDVGDAALATPEYIATQLETALAAYPALTVTRDGPYVFIQHATSISVDTSTGTSYMVASKSAVLSNVGNLPERLPANADTFTCRIGTGASAQFYRYVASSTEWLESGAYGSPTSITNTPISLIWTGAAWSLDSTAFFGRPAGDDTSNQAHEWTELGITGMGTYQGRLVLLSGPLVSLSASGSPRQFFRSTVTNLLTSDPIEIGAGMNSAAAYEWALPFQKDLVLFSRAYQAVIPSGNVAITPATATVVPTSSYDTDTSCAPIALGRTLMYCTPRSEDFFGAMEMIPSSYTDSQYMSQDATPHLPKYMGGHCRFAVSSSVANIALFAPSGDTQSLVVHEYHWDGDNKVQQAWHQWLFPYPVAAAYFASNRIVLVFVKNNETVLCTVDPRAGLLTSTGERRPFLDGYVSATITDHVVPIPDWMLAFDSEVGSKLSLVMLTGPMAGEAVGATLDPSGESFTTVLSYPSGTVGIGAAYYSGFIPSPPIIKDMSDQTIHSGKATLNRFMIGTKGTSEFVVNVVDSYTLGDEYGIPTLTFSSPELALGRGLYADVAISNVPCHTDLRSTAMEVHTHGTGELNITSLEYVAKYHPKIKRR
jgi:predicted small integral membrane protein